MGVEPLIAAVRSGDVRAVEALLEAGADPCAADVYGTCALCLAVDAFDLTIVEALLSSSGLDHTAADGCSPLLRAVDRGACDIAEALIRRGAPLGPGTLKDAMLWLWPGTGTGQTSRTSSVGEADSLDRSGAGLSAPRRGRGVRSCHWPA
ncbi:ankyrin repeat domain-containing protein [Streptomyces sp. NPDC018584]|uniref:ankyrin repeat domain-containing protein n=1 Tax=unclassified Streptomyces TaxID=2593676 RepID=UPI00378A885A